MMITVYLLIAYTQYSYSYIKDPEKEFGILHESQASCAYAIAYKYFRKGMVIYSVSVNPNITSATSTVDIDKRILADLNSQLKWPILTKFSVTNHSNWGKPLEGASGYILLINTLEDLQENIFLLKELPTWNPHGYFIILLTETAIFIEELLLQLVEELWALYIINAVVLIPNEDDKNSYKIVSWFPYINGGCGDSLAEYTYLDTCKNGTFVHKVNLFPDKVPKNLNACPINVIAIVWPPFIVKPIDFEIEGDEEIPLINGYEILMMQTVEQYLNCRFIYHSFSEPENWGHAYPNSSFSGLFEYLFERRADIGIGGIFPKPVLHEAFDYSLQYLQEQYVLVFPLAELAPGWRNFMAILTPEVFAACIISYIALSVTFYVLAKSSKEHSIFKNPIGAFLTILSVSLMNFMGVQPKYARLRTIFILWAYFNINLNAVFQSGLIRTYTYPLQNYQIKTENEIPENGLKVWGTDAIAMIYGVSEDHFSNYVMKHYVNIPAIKALEYIAHDKNITTISSRHYLSYIPVDVKRNIFVPKQNIITMPIEMLFVKGFPFRSKFNKIISHCKAAGLFERWKSHVGGYLHDNGTEDFKAMKDEEAKIVISLSDASGAFAFLIVGYILSTLAFLYEIIRKRMQKCLRKALYGKRKCEKQRPYSFVL